MKKWKIGIVGLGFGSILLSLNDTGAYSQEIRGNIDPNDNGECLFEVGGISSPRKSLDTLRKIAEAHNVPLYSNDYMDLVNSPDIDIIGVYNPDSLHYEVCMAALNAGKHVICTKPLTGSLEEAIAIAKKVDETGLKFLVGQTMRFEPQYATAKKLYDDGDLGEIVCCSAHYIHDMGPVYIETPWRRDLPQDFVYGGICHPVDVLRWFCGDVEEVFAYGNKPDIRSKGHNVKFDNYILSLKFKSGAIGSIRAMYDVVHPPLPMMELDLMGTKGSAVAEFEDFEPGELRVKLDKLPAKYPYVIPFPAQTSGDRGLGNTVMHYMRHFQDVMLGKCEAVPDARDGAKSIATCAAAYESMCTGKAVKVNNDF